MATWTQNNYYIVYQTQPILDFEEDSMGSFSMPNLGGIWIEYGILLKEKTPENQPYVQILFQVEFRKDNWKLSEAKKWYAENADDIANKILAQQNDGADRADKDPKKKDASHQAYRFDISELQNTKTTDQGYLQTDGKLTRTGIFNYRNFDGSIRRELRLPEEVFDKESMDSFGNLAVVDDHPPVFLNADNTDQYQKGHTFPEVVKDGDFIKSTLLITSADLIQKVNDGKTEISNGYMCQLDMTPGEWNGQKYDAIQREIRGNHVAIVDQGRAGPEAKLTLDGMRIDGVDTDFAYMVDSDSNIDGSHKTDTKGTKMAKLTIDNVEYDIDQSVAPVVSNALGVRDSRIAELVVSVKEGLELLGTVQAKADAAEAGLEKAKADKISEEDIAKMVNVRADERAVLLSSAKSQLTEEQFDAVKEKTDREIKSAVIGADPLFKDFVLEGKEDSYVDGLFDTAKINGKDRKDKTDKQAKDVQGTKEATDTEDSADKAYSELNAQYDFRSAGGKA